MRCCSQALVKRGDFIEDTLGQHQLAQIRRLYVFCAHARSLV